MFNTKTIILAKALRPDLNFASPGAEELVWLKIASRYASGNPVRNATIENGIATFGGVVASSPLVSLLLNIPVTQTGSGTPAPTNIRDFVGVSQAVISRTGINIWDEEWELGGIVYATGQNTPATTKIRSKNYIPCIPSTAYYFKGPFTNGVFFYNANKEYLGSSATLYPSDRAVFVPSGAYYMRFNLATSYGTTYNHDISINYPSTDTSYHAYTGNTYTISFGQTVYSAILDVLNGVLSLTHIRKAMSDFTWDIVMAADSGFDYNYFRISGNIEDMSNRFNQLICDCLDNKSHSRADLLNNEIGRYNSSSFNRRLCCRVDSITTIEDWNTFIADKYIVYELAEPIEIQLTPTVINTLIGENVIFADVADVTECKYTRK